MCNGEPLFSIVIVYESRSRHGKIRFHLRRRGQDTRGNGLLELLGTTHTDFEYNQFIGKCPGKSPKNNLLAIVLIEKIHISQSNYISTPNAFHHLLCCSLYKPISSHNSIIFDNNEIITSLRLEFLTELSLFPLFK